MQQSAISRARTASGCPVMPTTDQPWAENHRDSARVEKRGPSTTTSVPPSVTAQSAVRAASSATARPVGQ